MTLSLFNPGDTIAAGAIDQLTNIMARLPGQTDVNHYSIAGNCYTATGFNSWYTPSRSRNVVPVSVSIDSSDDGPTNYGGPATNHLSMGGCQVFTGFLSIVTSAHLAGIATFQY